MTANSVAVKLTVPSGFSGMFIATRRCKGFQGEEGREGGAKKISQNGSLLKPAPTQTA
jgi:hypothetical protein